MTRSSPSVAAVEIIPVIDRLLWQALALGALLVACVPAARAYSVWIGYLPFWLLVVPGFALLIGHRRRLAAAWRAVLVRPPRRRRTSRGGQARRLGFGPSPRRRSSPRAA